MPKKLLCLLIAAAAAVAVIVPVVTSAPSEDMPYSLPERVTLYRVEAGEILTLPYEDYLVGCLFAEVSPSCGEEALMAAACVMNSRSLLRLQSGERVNGADFTDRDYPWMSLEEAQEQHGSSCMTYRERLSEAARWGMERHLCFDGEPIAPPMCAISTGFTEDGGLPYLAAKTLPADKDSDEGLSTRAYPAANVRRVLSEVSGVASLPAAPSDWFGGAVYSEGGTLTEICFGEARITGEQLRDAFGLRSPAITVEFTEERFVFTVRGIGDNLGMSLHTAAQLAASGMTAEEILQSFYAPATVEVLKN